MYSTKFSFLLLIILLIPFGLKLTNHEPYPAIILPDGSSNIYKKDNQLNVDIRKIYGLDEHNHWKEVNQYLFMAPIPVRYFTYVILLDFNVGLLEEKWRKIYNYFDSIGLPRGTLSTTANEVRQRNQWIKDKLARQNLSTSRIKIATITMVTSTDSHSLLTKRIKDEKIIYLD